MEEILPQGGLARQMKPWRFRKILLGPLTNSSRGGIENVEVFSKAPPPHLGGYNLGASSSEPFTRCLLRQPEELVRSRGWQNVRAGGVGHGGPGPAIQGIYRL